MADVCSQSSNDVVILTGHMRVVKRLIYIFHFRDLGNGISMIHEEPLCVRAQSASESFFFLPAFSSPETLRYFPLKYQAPPTTAPMAAIVMMLLISQ